MGKQADRERGRVLLGSLAKSQTPESNLEETVTALLFILIIIRQIYINLETII